MTNQNNQTNKTPVLFVQPVANDVTPNEIEAECNAVAELRAVICQPTAAMAEVRKEFGGYFAGAGMMKSFRKYSQTMAKFLQRRQVFSTVRRAIW